MTEVGGKSSEANSNRHCSGEAMQTKTKGREVVDAAARLHELRAEFEQGQAKLIELDRHRQELRDGLLRISGAIQVLEELCKDTVDTSPEAESATVKQQQEP